MENIMALTSMQWQPLESSNGGIMLFILLLSFGISPVQTEYRSKMMGKDRITETNLKAIVPSRNVKLSKD